MRESTMKYSLGYGFAFFFTATLTACGGGGDSSKKNNPTFSSVNSISSNSSESSSSVNQTALILTANPNTNLVALDWTVVGGENYTLYIATSPDCDVNTFESCSGKLNTITNALPGNQNLENGKTYWFQLKSSSSKISNKVFARPDRIAVNNVKAIVTDENGTYIGGEFDRVGMITGSAALFDDESGESKPFPYVNGAVYASVSDGSGGIFIGGNFTAVGEKPRQGLAHILADGSVADWNPSVINGAVYALALSADSLYVGGEFASLNAGDSQSNFAVVDIIDGNVTDPGLSANERIRSLVLVNNQLFIGGDFTEINGEARQRLAQIDLADGLTNLNVDLNQRVRSIIVNETATTLWVGGDFTGNTRNKLIKLNFADDSWTMDTNWILRAQVYDEADEDYSDYYNAGEGDVYSMIKIDNTIYIAGDFTHVKNNGVNNERNYLAAVDSTSGAVSSWQPLVSDPVRYLSVLNNQIYAAGDFRSGVAAFDLQGNHINTWNAGTNGSVYTLAPTTQGFFAGGTFTSSITFPRSNLVALNADGSLKTNWVPTAEHSGSRNSQVNTLLLHNGNLYIGGYFSRLNGVGRFSIGAVNATTGELVENFNPPLTRAIIIKAIAIRNDTVYLGGTLISDNPDLYSVQLQTGAEITNWEPQFNGCSIPQACTINSLTIQDNLMYIGGKFEEYENTDRNNALALDLSTNIPTLTDWNPNIAGQVNSIVLSDDGSTAYLGGLFDQVKGEARTNFAIVSTQSEGTLLDSSAVSGQVNQLLLLEDILYIGSENQLLTFDNTGEEIEAVEMDGSIMALDHNLLDNTLHIGGDFTDGYKVQPLAP
jgi:hypothetical protein